jgi:hypothetical protein
MSKVERRTKRNPTSIYLTTVELAALRAMCQIEMRTQGEMMRELIRDRAKTMGINLEHADGQPA